MALRGQSFHWRQMGGIFWYLFETGRDAAFQKVPSGEISSCKIGCMVRFFRHMETLLFTKFDILSSFYLTETEIG